MLTIIANDAALSERLGRAVFCDAAREEGHGENSGGVHDEVMKMLAATVIGNDAEFARASSRFARDRQMLLLHRSYFPYVDWMDKILTRDVEGLRKVIDSADSTFRARMHEKSPTSERFLDGFGKGNKLTIDVWATALIECAGRRGMSFEVRSPFIPRL